MKSLETREGLGEGEGKPAPTHANYCNKANDASFVCALFKLPNLRKTKVHVDLDKWEDESVISTDVWGVGVTCEYSLILH